MWNPESTDMESGIHGVESGIQDSPGLPYMGREEAVLMSILLVSLDNSSMLLFILDNATLKIENFCSYPSFLRLFIKDFNGQEVAKLLRR